MRRTLPTLALCLLALGLPARAAGGERYALLVGVRQYGKGELSPLGYTENDVTALGLLLQAAGYKRVVIMTQSRGALEARNLPTAANVRKELTGLLEDRREDDTVVLAFCGHGLQFAGSDEPYFCPMDATLSPRANLLSLSEVYGELSRCKARSKVLLSDCCRNDPLPKTAPRAMGELVSSRRGARERVPENVVALFSCSAGEVAWETEAHRHGVFFHFLIEGLKGKAANGRKQVTLASLADYVQREVGDYVKAEIGADKRQRPEMVGRFSGPVVIADVTEAVRGESPKVVFETTRRGLDLMKDGQFAKVVSETSRGLAADPGAAFLLAMRAHARERLNDGRNALLDADRATKLDAHLNQPYHTRGTIYLRLQNQPRKAVAEFTESIRLNPRGAGSYYFRGLAHLQLDERDRAAEDFTEAIRLNPEHAAAYRMRADLSARAKDHDAALRDLNLAVEKLPTFAVAYVDRARLKHRALKDAAGALADYGEALRHDPRSAAAYYGRALVRIERKETDAAIADLTKAIEYEPRPVAALLERSYAFILKGDYRTGVADANKALELDPKSAKAHNNRGVCHAGMRKPEQALKDYTRAIELDGKVPLFYANRAKAHRRLGNAKLAEADEAKARAMGKGQQVRP